MITLLPDTRFESLSDDELAQLTESQAEELLRREIVDPVTGIITLDETEFFAQFSA